ncbi:hypothetical protein [Peribacillus simplex]|uniref:hypothetical protein n=1 Tax=Peribacillus simplex TaxID=1478 RepID=UPI00333ABBD0
MIVQGENGTIKSKKGIVYIKNIRNIDLVRNPLNLINENAKKVWDRKVDLDKLQRVAKYERQEQKMD